MPVCRSPYVFGGLLAAGLAMSGCAAPGTASGPQAAVDAANNDPFENTNRSLFSFNQGVDAAVLVPVAKTYRSVLPPPVRQSVHDFLQNLDEPVIFANDVLQGQPGLAGNTLARFTINSTAGIGGLFDVATRVGIPHHSNDFGVTLASWGLPDGPYIVIPVLGPSNVRDAVGRAADSYADPGNIVAGNYHYIWATVARAGVEGIDTRSRNIENLEEIERTSLDYYATIRSLYQQRRQAEIRHEQSSLPNPSPMGGDSAGPAMSYTVAPPAPAK
jgi:phospholipid-binding lipoprotein MlaA